MVCKQILPLVYDLVHPKFMPFLHLIRILAQITMHAQFKLQSILRIEVGEELILEFGKQLQVSQGNAHIIDV
jgi:hypothetical protein